MDRKNLKNVDESDLIAYIKRNYVGSQAIYRPEVIRKIASDQIIRNRFLQGWRFVK